MNRPRAQDVVSAIVVSYFTGPLLARSLAALRADGAIGEIILVDSGNGAGAIDRALEDAVTETPEGAEIIVLSGEGNVGFAAACNRAARQARHPLLLFINPDAVMAPGGASRLVADAAGLERPWLMGAKLVNPDGSEQQGSRRNVLTPWRAFVEAARLYRLAPNHPYFQRFNLHQQPCPDEIAATATLSGACLFIPATDYWSVDGMDERYFLHVEDVDFCLRFAKSGGNIYFNPHVCVVHYKSSSRANAVRIEARKTRSMIRYFNVHFAQAYPRPFLWLLSGLLWALFGVLLVRRAIGKMLRLAGLRRRAGPDGVRRAQSMASRRSSR